jgi:predicted metal-dependent HD superfamily phosphohydrolase
MRHALTPDDPSRQLTLCCQQGRAGHHGLVAGTTPIDTAATVPLMKRWEVLVGPGAAATGLGKDLLERWSEPHRSYHTVKHLEAVLDRLDQLGGATMAVTLAAWYHDAVYEPARDDNEAASAALALATLPSAGVDQATVSEVRRLVKLTATHRPEPADAAGALLCDADVAVLGGNTEEYAAYRLAVRAEYRALDEPSWRRGRSSVLRSLLARDPLFSTAEGRRRWEQAARVNLQSELADLVEA